MKNKPKKVIEVKAPLHQYFDIDFLSGDINEVIEKLKDFVPKHKEFIANLKEEHGFKIDPNWLLINRYEITFNRYYEDIELVFKFYRDETDEEYKSRLKKETQVSKRLKEQAKQRKEEQEKKERELYEELKKKYG